MPWPCRADKHTPLQSVSGHNTAWSASASVDRAASGASGRPAAAWLPRVRVCACAYTCVCACVCALLGVNAPSSRGQHVCPAQIEWPRPNHYCVLCYPRAPFLLYCVCLMSPSCGLWPRGRPARGPAPLSASAGCYREFTCSRASGAASSDASSEASSGGPMGACGRGIGERTAGHVCAHYSARILEQVQFRSSSL